MIMMMTIYPYLKSGVWMFDDAAKDLLEEPFVLGTGEILESALHQTGIWPGAHHGFRLDFSGEPQEGWFHAVLLYPENGGAWYQCGEQRGWLCPMLMRYFLEPPDTIWFRVGRKGTRDEVNP